MLPVLRELDRTRFELYCYGEEENSTITGLQNALHFQTGGLSDTDFTALLRSHALDLLIDLSPIGPGYRGAAWAARCAPLQLSYLGQLGPPAFPRSIICWPTRSLFPNPGKRSPPNPFIGCPAASPASISGLLQFPLPLP